MKIRGLSRLIIATGLAGVLVSTYALYVEMAAEAHPGYKALCDISEHASCSKVLTSEYSKGFGIIPKDSPLEVPNCIYGIIFYCLMIFLATYDHTAVIRLQVVLALTACASSVYLAFLLAFVLYDFCVVCVSTYLINALLLIICFRKSKLLEVRMIKNK